MCIFWKSSEQKWTKNVYWKFLQKRKHLRWPFFQFSILHVIQRTPKTWIIGDDDNQCKFVISKSHAICDFESTKIIVFYTFCFLIKILRIFKLQKVRVKVTVCIWTDTKKRLYWERYKKFVSELVQKHIFCIGADTRGHFLYWDRYKTCVFVLYFLKIMTKSQPFSWKTRLEYR